MTCLLQNTEQFITAAECTLQNIAVYEERLANESAVARMIG